MKKTYAKKRMGPQHLLNPKPVVLIGTIIDKKPNFITVSWVGNTSLNPPTIAIAIRNIRHSLKGLEKNNSFSVNIPSVSQVEAIDYCGTVSGSEVDKAKKCEFELFNGKLKNAPLIKQFPINMECKIIKTIKVGDHSLFIGEVIESYINENCFTNDIPDIKKIDPISFVSITKEDMGYYDLGEMVMGYN